MCVYVFVWVCARELDPTEGTGFPGADVTGDC